MKKPLGTLFAVLAVLASQVHAASLTCGGKVTQVTLHASDKFMVQLDSMNVPAFFCQPNATWTPAGAGYSTSAETCRALIAIFLAAKAQDKAFSAVYFDGDDVPAACNSWTAWKSVSIRYFLWAD